MKILILQKRCLSIRNLVASSLDAEGPQQKCRQMVADGVVGGRRLRCPARPCVIESRDRRRAVVAARLGGRGVLAAWCADEYRLGAKAACTAELGKALGKGWLSGAGLWPQNKAYVTALLKKLAKWGYVS
jgi:hypothetical protein